MSEFSVIIPTLQRSDELHPLVEQCAAHPLVLEVLVINNAPEPLSWGSPKVRVLQQAENIYVNPAWNLGAREARGKYLAIINDDIRFADEAFSLTATALRRGWFGIVSPSRSCFFPRQTGSPGFRLADTGSPFRGTFMAMRRLDYVPVPDDLLIWGGDDWLFMNQRRPNAVLVNTPFVTDMGTTSGSDEFRAMRVLERERTAAHLSGVHRWWHWPASALLHLRRARGLAAGALSDIRLAARAKHYAG